MDGAMKLGTAFVGLCDKAVCEGGKIGGKSGKNRGKIEKVT